MLARRADRQQTKRLAAAIDELAPDVRHQASHLVYRENERLSRDDERELALQHQIQLFLVLVRMDASLFSWLQAQDVDAHAGGAEFASQRLEPLAGSELEATERETWGQCRLPELRSRFVGSAGAEEVELPTQGDSAWKPVRVRRGRATVTGLQDPGARTSGCR